jgi:hypothetical protein
MNNLRGEFTFDINGKKYEAVITLNALRLMCQAHKIKLEELDKFMQEDSMTAICSMTYWGIKNAAMRKGKESKLMGFDQFCALVLDDGETFESLAQAVTSTLDAPEGNE